MLLMGQGLQLIRHRSLRLGRISFGLNLSEIPTSWLPLFQQRIHSLFLPLMPLLPRLFPPKILPAGSRPSLLPPRLNRSILLMESPSGMWFSSIMVLLLVVRFLWSTGWHLFKLLVCRGVGGISLPNTWVLPIFPTPSFIPLRLPALFNRLGLPIILSS